MTTTIHFLPQKSLGAVMQITPELKISCFFAPRELRVNLVNYNRYDLDNFFDDYCLKCEHLKSYNKKGKVNYGNCNGGLDILIDGGCMYSLQTIRGERYSSSYITTLPYIVSMLFGEEVEKGYIPNSFKIYTYDHKRLIKDKTLYGLPYLLANVYQDGTVCWGSSNNRTSVQIDLRYLHNLFWISPFNKDLLPSVSLELNNWIQECSLEELKEYEHDFEPEYLQVAIKGDSNLVVSNTHSSASELELIAAFYSEESKVVDRVAQAKPKKGSNVWYAAGWVYKGLYQGVSQPSYYVMFGKQAFSLDIKNKELGDLVQPILSPSTNTRSLSLEKQIA